MKSTILKIALLLVGVGTLHSDAAAQTIPAKVVIELFTSQGCSSCPPADALLESYTGRDDVIALSVPVDYWDRLGWKDTFASREHTNRQRDYASARGDGQVYTPQVVISGKFHVVGSSRSAIDGAIAAAKTALRDSQVPLRVHFEDGALVVQVRVVDVEHDRMGRACVAAAEESPRSRRRPCTASARREDSPGA